MTQSREKEKRKPKEKPKKINKTTRNLVSGYYPEMRFFLLKRKRREKRKEKVKKEVVDEPWNNSKFNRNRTFWHQNKKKESQKKCQKRKKKKPKENQKEIGLVVLLALFFGKPDGHAVA